MHTKYLIIQSAKILAYVALEGLRGASGGTKKIVGYSSQSGLQLLNRMTRTGRYHI
jgi:hypothetical protein